MMEWLTFDGVNWLGVAVAFVACFAFGWVWYSPQGFFRVWQKAAGFTDEDMKEANMASAFGGTVAGNLLGVVLMAVLVVQLGVSTWTDGLVLGLVLGLVFRGGAHALHNGFALRNPKVTLIDTAHDTLALAIAGAVLAAM